MCIFISHPCSVVVFFFKINVELQKNRAFHPKNTRHLQIAVDPYVFPILSAPSDDA